MSYPQVTKNASLSIAPDRDASVRHHVVQFYESESYLREAVCRFLGPGFTDGSPLIMIAVPEHQRLFRAGLQLKGSEFDTAIRSGQLLQLDVRETLAKFMEGDLPDGGRFLKIMSAVIQKANAGRENRTLLAYGEMVDVLWREGKCEAAIRLEHLWNELAAAYDFRLFCAYGMNGFCREADRHLFENICRTHSKVIPTEHYTELDKDERSLEIALLQQRARALESEILGRKEMEAFLIRALQEGRKKEEKLRQTVAERDELLIREREARSEAEAATRMKDEFLAVLSHELRTPLNAILGWTGILNSHKDEDLRQRAVAVIQRNAEIQKRLIEDLLDMTRILTGKMVIKNERVDLPAVLHAAVDSVRTAAGAKAITINLKFDDTIRFIGGDSDRLQQVAWNLLSNAIKFTPLKGTVEVRLQSAGSHAEVRVHDTGEGISADFLPHVFERFSQANGNTTRQHEGIGVGLAVVRYLIEAHGGTVRAISDGKGKGSTFIVSLPMLGLFL